MKKLDRFEFGVDISTEIIGSAFKRDFAYLLSLITDVMTDNCADVCEDSNFPYDSGEDLSIDRNGVPIIAAMESHADALCAVVDTAECETGQPRVSKRTAPIIDRHFIPVISGEPTITEAEYAAYSNPNNSPDQDAYFEKIVERWLFENNGKPQQ